MPIRYLDSGQKQEKPAEKSRGRIVYVDKQPEVPIDESYKENGDYLFRIGKLGGKPFGDSWAGMAGNLGIGGLEGAMSVAAGIPSSVAGALASAYGMAKNGRAGNDKTIEMQQKAIDTFGYQPQTDAGKRLMEIASYPFKKVEDVANVASDKTFEKTGSVPATLATNIGVQAVPTLLASALGLKLKRSGESRIANLSDRQKLAIEGYDKGYRVNQAEVNPTVSNKMRSSLSYQPDIDAALSKINQRNTQIIANTDNRLQPSANISRNDMAGIRAQEGAHYEAIKKLGGDIDLSVDFHNKVGNAAGPAFPKTSFGETTNPAIKAISDDLAVLSKNKVSLPEAVGKWQQWRDAATAYRDKSVSDSAQNRTHSRTIAKFYDDASDALKKEIVDGVKKRGYADIANNFDEAAKRIATAHSTSEAIIPGPNVVSARKLGLDLAADAPISGDMNLSGRMANAFPSMMDTGLGSPPFSQLDAGSASSVVSGLMGAATGVNTGGGIFRGGTLPLVRSLAKRSALKASEKGFNPYDLPDVRKYPALALALEAYQESLRNKQELQ